MGRLHPNLRRARRRGSPASRESFESQLIIGCIIVAVVAWNATPLINARLAGTAQAVGDPETAAAPEARERSVYYAGCREARAAGAAPIYQGQPGYRPEMDGDGDGIACEDYHRW